MVPAATVVTGFTFVFTFCIWLNSIVRSLYFKIILAYAFITFLYHNNNNNNNNNNNRPTDTPMEITAPSHKVWRMNLWKLLLRKINNKLIIYIWLIRSYIMSTSSLSTRLTLYTSKSNSFHLIHTVYCIIYSLITQKCYLDVRKQYSHLTRM